MTDAHDSQPLPPPDFGAPNVERTDFASMSDLPPPPLLDTASQTALFLDFDGTLVEIAERPGAVVVPPDLPGLLMRLASALDGRLAIVSGRSLAALDALLGPVGVAMAGSHGGEFRPAGSSEILAEADPLPAQAVSAFLDFAKGYPGLIVEPKPFSVAVHYRQVPQARDALLEASAKVAARFGLGIKHGKQVAELSMPGSDKGTAVTRFMAMPPFAGTTPIFLGDDVTDEDAFTVLDRFGGSGVLVGPMRDTAACWRLPDVAAVREWLAATKFDNGEAQA